MTETQKGEQANGRKRKRKERGKRKDKRMGERGKRKKMGRKENNHPNGFEVERESLQEHYLM